MHCVVALTRCPHAEAAAFDLAALSALDVERPCAACGDEGENWVCLHCAALHCSSYRAGHARAHYERTAAAAEEASAGAAPEAGSAAGAFVIPAVMDSR